MLFHGKPCTFINEPDFLFEAADILTDRDGSAEQDLVQKHDKLGLTAEQMRDNLRCISDYRTAVLSDVARHIDANADLVKYFALSRDVRSYVSLLAASELRTLGRGPYTHEEIDRILWNDIMSGAILLDGDEVSEPPCGDTGAMFERLLESSLEDSTKLLIIGSYSVRYDVITRLAHILWETADACKRHYRIVESEFTAAVESYADIHDLGSYLSSLGITFDGVMTEAYVSICSFNSIFLYSSGTGDNVKVIIKLGMLFPVFTELAAKQQESVTLTVLKTISEPVRWQILTLIKSNRLSQKEIADAVGLTPPTVSYHLDALLNCSLIKVNIPEGKRRALYSLNGAKLISIAEALTKLGGEGV